MLVEVVVMEEEVGSEVGSSGEVGSSEVGSLGKVSLLEKAVLVLLTVDTGDVKARRVSSR